MCWPGSRNLASESTFELPAGDGDDDDGDVFEWGSIDAEETRSLPDKSSCRGVEYRSCGGVRECVAKR